MTPEPRKMVENYSRVFGKTMGVKAPNNARTTIMNLKIDELTNDDPELMNRTTDKMQNVIDELKDN